MKIYCRVTDMGLVPMYDSDYDEKKKLRVGENVLCDISKPRNYEFHKKFFALIRLVLDNLPEHISDKFNIYSEEDMLDALKVDLGLYNIVYVGGKQLVKVGSISFAKMDNTEFERFYNRSIDIVLNKYMNGTERFDLIEEINRFK